MRALPLAALLAGLAGCVIVDPYARPAPQYTRPVAQPSRSSQVSSPAGSVLTRDEAVQAAFRVAADRQLEVDRVQHAHLDSAGRWHVDLLGSRDRAQVVIDSRDGRFLQGRFRSGGEAPAASSEAAPPATTEWPAAAEPPTSPKAPGAQEAPASPEPPAQLAPPPSPPPAAPAAPAPSAPPQAAPPAPPASPAPEAPAAPAPPAAPKPPAP
jgi:hypothetical protein